MIPRPSWSAVQNQTVLPVAAISFTNASMSIRSDSCTNDRLCPPGFTFTRSPNFVVTLALIVVGSEVSESISLSLLPLSDSCLSGVKSEILSCVSVGAYFLLVASTYLVSTFLA